MAQPDHKQTLANHFAPHSLGGKSAAASNAAVPAVSSSFISNDNDALNAAHRLNGADSGITAPHTHARHKIAIALQGGGSWGAFSWGVLDRLLEDPDIQIAEIAGTSAGAMSGSIVAHAVNSAATYDIGAKQAREDLSKFWRCVCDSNHSLMALLTLTQNGAMAGFVDPVSNPNLPALHWFQSGKAMMDSNPFAHMMGLSGYFNRVVEGMAASKLRSMVRNFIPSFDAIREGKHLKLHVNAARLTPNGFQNTVFSGQDLNINAVLASATLRGLFKPIEIDNNRYYDGAYSQNPPLDPLLRPKAGFGDILWIMANPPRGTITPRPQNALTDKDLRATNDLVLHQAYDHLAHAVKTHGKGSPFHHVVWFNAPDHYDQTSKQNTEKAFLEYLFKQGRAAGEDFIKTHKAKLGKDNSADLPALQREAKRRELSRGAYTPPKR